MDPFSDQYMRMNRRITNAPDVQAKRRSPSYKETYEARPPKFY